MEAQKKIRAIDNSIVSKRTVVATAKKGFSI
jgi:hypothetical protein